MKKTIIVTSIAAILGLCVFAGAAVGTSQIDWGSHKGWPIAKIKIDNQQKEPPSPAIIIHGTTYVPLRFVSESMGIGVGWDQTNRTVLLNSDGSSSTTEDTDGYSIPPVSQSENGVTITINKLTVTSASTTLNVTVTNNSGKYCDFIPSLAMIATGGTLHESPTNHSEVFLTDVGNGESMTYDLVYPGATEGSTFTVFFTAQVGEAMDAFEPVFYIK